MHISTGPVQNKTTGTAECWWTKHVQELVSKRHCNDWSKMYILVLVPGNPDSNHLLESPGMVKSIAGLLYNVLRGCWLCIIMSVPKDREFKLGGLKSVW